MDEPEARRIASFLDLRASAPRADLAFVFGSKLAEPAYLAADLFVHGSVRRIVLTGGPNPLTDVNAADAHLALLLEWGVPGNRILVENESKNTSQNVELALAEVAKEPGLDRFSSVVAVMKWYHARRAMMTLRHHLLRAYATIASLTSRRVAGVVTSTSTRTASTASATYSRSGASYRSFSKRRRLPR